MTDRGPYSFENSIFTPTFSNPETTLDPQNTELTLKDSIKLTHSSYAGYSNLPSSIKPNELYNDDMAVKPMKKVKNTQANINMLGNVQHDTHNGQRLNRNNMPNLGLKINNDLQDQDQKLFKHEDSTLTTPVPYSSFSKASTNYFSEAADTPRQPKPEPARTPVINKDQQEAIQIAMERSGYATFFNELHDNLVIAFQRQLEFINLLKEMNNPDKAQYWPVLDKINPLIAGVMSRKTKIDENTLTVMKRTHTLMKSGPIHRTPQSQKKITDQDGKTGEINGKRDYFQYEMSRNDGQMKKKESEEDISQIMNFILYDNGNVKQEPEFKEGQKKEES